MGCVWAARDELLGREVAVKELVLPGGMAPEDVRELGERALREARSIARLDHRNVVRIFDVVFTGGRPCIVMELVPSRSLYEVVSSDGPMPPDQVARIGLGVLAALRAAHRAGILHRDVKPANVLLGDDGRVVLTDFGLATAYGDSSMTSTGIVLGSPSYLAPERTADGEIGPAADLWSLGATLYAAVEGRPPYAKSSPMTTLTALATEPPRPPEQAGVLGPVLAALLEKNPARRADAETAEQLLRQAAAGKPEDALPVRRWAGQEATRPLPTMRAPSTGDRPEQRPATREPSAGFAQTTADPTRTAADPTLVTNLRPARNRGNRRLLIVAAAILALAAGIAARPAISSALTSDAVAGDTRPSDAVADDTRAGDIGSSGTRDPRSTNAPPPVGPGAKSPQAPATQPSTTDPTPAKGSRTTSPTPVPPGHAIQNLQTGTCLYAPGTTGEVKLWACSTIGPQQFRFAADGTMRVRGRCVTVANLANGAHLLLKSCGGGATQQFSYNTSDDLVSGAANKCVDVPDGSAANDVPAQIWECTGAANQKWHY
jgi:serine/threonine protein kinase